MSAQSDEDDRVAKILADIDWCKTCNTPIGVGVCDGCIAAACCDMDYPDEEEPVCGHCGKPIYDWSDVGCSRCDARNPAYGLE